MTKSKKETNMYFGWWIVIGAFILMFLSYGIRYSFGVYLKPLSAEFGWSRATVSGAFSIYMIMYSVGALVMGTLTDRLGPRIVCTAGAILIGTGIIMVSFTQEVWHIYITYGIITALGAGAMYVPPSATVTKFFIKKRGMALGFASAGVGLGTFVMAPISQIFISSYGWRTGYVFSGLLAIVIGIPIAILLMKRSPEDIGLLPDGEKPSDTILENASISDNKTEAKSQNLEKNKVREALKTIKFFLFFLMYTLLCIVLTGIFAHVAAHANDVGIDKLDAAAALGGIGLLSIAGRVLLGIVGDAIGRRLTCFIISIVLSGTMLIFMATNTVLILWIAVIIYGFFYGGFAPNSAGLLADIFGSDIMGSLLGTITIGAGIGGAFGSWFGGFIFDSTGSYDKMFWIFAIILIISGIISIFLTPVKKKS